MEFVFCSLEYAARLSSNIHSGLYFGFLAEMFSCLLIKWGILSLEYLFQSNVIKVIFFTRNIWIYVNKERLIIVSFSHTLNYLGKFVSVCKYMYAQVDAHLQLRRRNFQFFSFLPIEFLQLSALWEQQCFAVLSCSLLPYWKAPFSTPWLERISAVLYVFRATVRLNQGNNEIFKVCTERQITFLSVRRLFF